MNEELREMIAHLKSLPDGAEHRRGPALVIRESDGAPGWENLLEMAGSAVPVSYARYSGGRGEDSLLESIEQELTRGIWPILELESEPSPRVIEFLRQRSALAQAPGGGRVLVLCDRNLIEHGMSFPYFYELFGWVCSV